MSRIAPATIRDTLTRLTLALAILAAAPLLRAQTSALPSASEIFAKAKTTAAVEHKNILLVFSASWCGPCRQFEGFLEDPQISPIMAKYFVTARFAVGEEIGHKPELNTPGGDFLRASLGGAASGYPYIVAANPQGQVLVNSYRPVPGSKTGENIGYPAIPAEIDWFMKMLQQSAPSMSTEEAASIRHWLDQRGQS